MMKHIELNASLCEPFKKRMNEAEWNITHQDVGQTELVGYGYVIVWEKSGDKVVLHYSDRQGIAQANLEVTSNIIDTISEQIKSL